MNEMVRQETNMTDFRAISDLDCIDCHLFLTIQFNHHKPEIRQITHINMITTHFMAFTGMANFPDCDPNDFTIPYNPIVDC
jgi:hypothetical protein